jgi:hypothetical protein
MGLMNWMLVFYGIVGAVFGMYIFGIGLWGLLNRRPLVFPARQLMWFLLLCYLPITVQSFVPLLNSRGHVEPFFIFLPFVQITMIVLLVFVFWRQMTGYMIFGVSDDTFRDGLISALTKLNLPFKETISKIKLTELDADLQASVASWMGTAQIRMKQPQHLHYAQEIAGEMSVYYKNNQVKVQKITFIIYLLVCILMIIFVSALALLGPRFLS